jgi:bacteriorhodopsin
VLVEPTDAKNKDLKSLLKIEYIVNLIEGTFYVWMLTNFGKIKNITKFRYYDWILTTPTMLFTYMMYILIVQKEENREEHNLANLVSKEKYTIVTVLLLNWLMLYCGYLSETKQMGVKLSVFLGFIPFTIMFYIIYQKYARHTTIGKSTFVYFVCVWALYGVAALCAYKLKNVLYNILDLFAKNFFALFLAIVLWRRNRA